MLLKAGVDISRLRPEIRKRLSSLDRLWRVEGNELVITATYEGTHSPGSLHYANLAIDLRWPAITLTGFLDNLRGVLGPDYDIIPHKTHIHIEFDPK